jgi:hypothetical protein
MNAELTGGMDEYALKHLAEHLYKSGPRMHDELYNLVTDIKWYQTQQDYDPSRRTYISGLDQAIQVAKEQEELPPLFLPLILIRSTLNSLLENISNSVVKLLSLIGQDQQVKHYTELLADNFKEHETLCQIAIAEFQRGDTNAAFQTLDKAEKLILVESASNGDPYPFALLAETANNIGAEEQYKRSYNNLQAILCNNDWSITQFIQDLGLFERPNYLEALAAEKLLSKKRKNHLRAIPIIARLAGEDSDIELLSNLIDYAEQNDIENDSLDDLIFALADSGHCQIAYDSIIRFEISEGDGEFSSYIPYIALKAGQRGEVDTIIKLITTSPDWEDNYIESNNADQLEPIERITKGAVELIIPVIKKVYGLDPNQFVIFIMSLGGLGKNHPQETGILWEQLHAPHPRLAKFIAGPIAKIISFIFKLFPHLQSSGEEGKDGVLKSPKKPTAWIPLLKISSKIVALIPEEFFGDEIKTIFIATKASYGDFDQALQDVHWLYYAANRRALLEDLAKIALRRAEIDNAIKVVYHIGDSSKAKYIIELICDYLVNNPHEGATSHIPKVIKSIDQLPAEESPYYADLTTCIWETYAHSYSAKRAWAAIEGINIETNLPIIIKICHEAASQHNLMIAEETYQLINKLTTSYDFGDKDIDATQPEYFSLLQNSGFDPCQALSELSVQFSLASESCTQKDERIRWASLAKSLYHLAKDCLKFLPPVLQRNNWNEIVRAARFIKDRKILINLWKTSFKGKFYDDKSLVQLSAGLTSVGEYMSGRNQCFPEVLLRIDAKAFKTQALVLMSRILRAIPPEKRLFGGYDIDDLRTSSDHLLRLSREELGLVKKKYPVLDTDKLYSNRLSSTQYSLPKSSRWGYGGRKQKVGRALIQIIEEFTELGLYDDVIKIADEFTPKKERPIVNVYAIIALRKAGKKKQSNKLFDNLKPQKKSSDSGKPIRVNNLVYAGIAQEQAAKKPDKAWKTLKNEVLPDVWESSYLPEVLDKCTKVVTQLEKQRRWEYIHLLIEDETLTRNQAIQRLAALMPILGSLLDEGQYKAMVKKIFETETFW